MREALGGVSIFQIVILFILVFTGVMCLTINHSKAFGVKDEIINIIQNEPLASKLNGSTYQMTSDTSKKIADALALAGYRVTGSCPKDYQGYDREGNLTNSRAAYCIKINNVTNSFNNDIKDKCTNNKCVTVTDDYPEMVYYDVILFYQLDIPIINSIMNFKIYGSTKTVMR